MNRPWFNPISTAIPTGWQALKIGAGGLVTGFSGHPDGTLLCRCDTFGAYRFDRNTPSSGNAGGLGQWTQLLNTDAMPSDVSGNANPFSGFGCYDLQVAPSNSSVFYMFGDWGGFTSANKGNLWFHNNMGGGGTLSNTGNDGPKVYQNKCQIDPNNVDCAIIVPGNDHPYESTNGTACTASGTTTWTAITTIPAPTGLGSTGQGIGIVAYDPNSGTTSGRTNTTYVASWGSAGGIYVRTTPTGSWSALTGAPSSFITGMFCCNDGTLYVVDASTPAPNNKTWRLVGGPGGTWTNITFTGNSSPQFITVDKTNSQTLYCWTANGGWVQTANARTGAPPSYSGVDSLSGSKNIVWQIKDCPMLGSIHLSRLWGNSFGAGPFIDPFDTTKIWMSGNQAVFSTSNPSLNFWQYTFTFSSALTLGTQTITTSPFSGATYQSGDGFIYDAGGGNEVQGIVVTAGVGTATVNITQVQGSTIAAGSYIVNGAPVFNSRSAGIEQIVGVTVTSPGNGLVFAGGWDCGVIPQPNSNTFPSGQGWNTTAGIEQCSDVDYASSDATFICAADGFPAGSGTDAYSTSSGTAGTWQAFASRADPSASNQQGGGYIAAATGGSTTANIVRIYTQQSTTPSGVSSTLFYTTNNGGTWTGVVPSGTGVNPATTGWGSTFTGSSKRLCADRDSVNAPNTFYTANFLTTAGLMRSTNSGATWSLMIPNTGATAFDNQGFVQLKSVPGHAGHLFFSNGTPVSGPYPNLGAANPSLYRVTDGGVGGSWTNVNNANYQINGAIFGFGGIKSGQSYPSVLVWGWVNALGAGYVFGVWESVDNCTTWQQIGNTYPNKWIDQITDITGDPSHYGPVWCSCKGSGFRYLSR